MGRDNDSNNAVVLLGIIVLALIVGASPNGCVTGQQSPDVVLLPKPPFDIYSNATNDLLDPDFRSMVQGRWACGWKRDDSGSPRRPSQQGNTGRIHGQIN